MNKESTDDASSYISLSPEMSPALGSQFSLAESSENEITDNSDFVQNMTKIVQKITAKEMIGNVKSEINFIKARTQAEIENYISILTEKEDEISELKKLETTQSACASSLISFICKSLTRMLKNDFIKEQEKELFNIEKKLKEFEALGSGNWSIEELYLSLQNLINELVTAKIEFTEVCFKQKSEISKLEKALSNLRGENEETKEKTTQRKTQQNTTEDLKKVDSTIAKLLKIKESNEELCNSVRNLTERALGFRTNDPSSLELVWQKIYDHDELAKENETLKEKIEKLENIVSKQKETIKTAKDDNEVIHYALTSAAKKYNSLLKEKEAQVDKTSTLEEENQQIINQIKEKEATIEALKQKIKEGKNAQKELINKIKEMEQNSGESGQLIASFCEKTNHYKHRINDLKAQRNNLKTLTAQKDNEINVLTQRYEAVVKQLADASSELSDKLHSELAAQSLSIQNTPSKELQREREQNEILVTKLNNILASLTTIQNMLSKKPNIQEIVEYIQSVIEENNLSDCVKQNQSFFVTNQSQFDSFDQRKEKKTISSKLPEAPSSILPLSSTFFESSSSSESTSTTSNLKNDQLEALRRENALYQRKLEKAEGIIKDLKNKANNLEDEKLNESIQSSNLIKIKETECNKLRLRVNELTESLFTTQAKQSTLERLRSQYTQEHTELHQVKTTLEKTREIIFGINSFIQSSQYTLSTLLSKLSALFDLYSLPINYGIRYRNYTLTTRAVANNPPTQQQTRQTTSFASQNILLSQIYSKMKNFPIDAVRSKATTAPLTCFSSFISLYDDINSLLSQLEFNSNQISSICGFQKYPYIY